LQLISTRRLVVLVIALADLWRAQPDTDLVWAVVICDGAAAGLIFFAKQIDDITFGTTQRGGKIDAHTPPFLIAGLGWLLLFGFSTLLFFGRLVRHTGV
jgi:hypothetical protein